MKNTRIIIFAITIILGLAILVGIIIQLHSPKPILDVAYELIAFLVSAAAVFIALISQISSYRERREYSKIIRELNEIIAETESDKAIDIAAAKKLDELLALERRIYQSVSKTTKRKTK